VALLCFDLSKSESDFENIVKWYEKLCSCGPSDKFFVYLIGTKSDLEQRTPDTKVESFINNYNKVAKYMKCSAKEGINIEEIFTNLVTEFDSKGMSRKNVTGSVKISNTNQSGNTNQKRCCGK
jgi:GTPase SAR1 family protein